MKNKVLAAVMAAAMIASSVPGMAMAADVTKSTTVDETTGAVTTEFEDGTVKTYSADGNQLLITTSEGDKQAVVNGAITELQDASGDKSIKVDMTGVTAVEKVAVKSAKGKTLWFKTKAEKKAFKQAAKKNFKKAKWKKLKAKIALKVEE